MAPQYDLSRIWLIESGDERNHCGLASAASSNDGRVGSERQADVQASQDFPSKHPSLSVALSNQHLQDSSKTSENSCLSARKGSHLHASQHQGNVCK